MQKALWLLVAALLVAACASEGVSVERFNNDVDALAHSMELVEELEAEGLVEPDSESEDEDEDEDDDDDDDLALDDDVEEDEMGSLLVSFGLSAKHPCFKHCAKEQWKPLTGKCNCKNIQGWGDMTKTDKEAIAAAKKDPSKCNCKCFNMCSSCASFCGCATRFNCPTDATAPEVSGGRTDVGKSTNKCVRSCASVGGYASPLTVRMWKKSETNSGWYSRNKSASGATAQARACKIGRSLKCPACNKIPHFKVEDRKTAWWFKQFLNLESAGGVKDPVKRTMALEKKLASTCVQTETKTTVVKPTTTTKKSSSTTKKSSSTTKKSSSTTKKSSSTTKKSSSTTTTETKPANELLKAKKADDQKKKSTSGEKNRYVKVNTCLWIKSYRKQCFIKNKCSSKKKFTFTCDVYMKTKGRYTLKYNIGPKSDEPIANCRQCSVIPESE